MYLSTLQIGQYVYLCILPPYTRGMGYPLSGCVCPFGTNVALCWFKFILKMCFGCFKMTSFFQIYHFHTLLNLLHIRYHNVSLREKITIDVAVLYVTALQFIHNFMWFTWVSSTKWIIHSSIEGLFFWFLKSRTSIIKMMKRLCHFHRKIEAKKATDFWQ
jgi:hypothetical protein